MWQQNMAKKGTVSTRPRCHFIWLQLQYVQINSPSAPYKTNQKGTNNNRHIILQYITLYMLYIIRNHTKKQKVNSSIFQFQMHLSLPREEYSHIGFNRTSICCRSHYTTQRWSWVHQRCEFAPASMCSSCPDTWYS